MSGRKPSFLRGPGLLYGVATAIKAARSPIKGTAQQLESSELEVKLQQEDLDRQRRRGSLTEAVLKNWQGLINKQREDNLAWRKGLGL